MASKKTAKKSETPVPPPVEAPSELVESREEFTKRRAQELGLRGNLYSQKFPNIADDPWKGMVVVLTKTMVELEWELVELKRGK
jgi:hypothetical protein